MMGELCFAWRSVRNREAAPAFFHGTIVALVGSRGSSSQPGAKSFFVGMACASVGVSSSSFTSSS
jgi:hypothetical protein